VLVAVGASAHASLHSVLSRLDGADVVVLHDAHRPLAPPAVVAAVVAALGPDVDAAVPVVEVTETVKEVDAAGVIVRTVPREDLVQVQFPQAVRGPVLVAAHAACAPGDPLLPAGARVATVPGARDAFPVLDAYDLQLAAAVLAART
jgi:2-C-methyl-D-erythritol 4-phosphate cytidylyltransferase